MSDQETKYDLKALTEAIKERVITVEHEYSANEAGGKVFGATYPQPEKPEYQRLPSQPVAMFDHSAGYIGVKVNDTEHRGAEIVLLFSVRDQLQEVYIDFEDYDRLRTQIDKAAELYMQATVKREAHAQAVEAYKAALEVWQAGYRGAREMGEKIWKKLKRAKKLQDPSSEIDEILNDAPF